jgi:hypothetical protein
MDTALIAALVGTVAAALTTWLLDIRRDRAADRRREQESRALRCAEFLGATHQGALSITLLATEPMPTKQEFFTSGFYTSSETRESTALNAIQLLDSEEVVKACLRLHAALVSLERQALNKQWNTEEWSSIRDAVGPWVDGVVSAALSALGRPELTRAAEWAAAKRDVESAASDLT